MADHPEDVLNTEAIAIGIAISIALLWWLDRAIGLAYHPWATSDAWAELRDGWNAQPHTDQVGIVALLLVVCLYPLALITAMLT